MPPDFTLPPDFSIFDINLGIDLTGLEPIDWSDYVSISPGGPSGGSSSAVTLSGGIENYKNSLTGGANYFDIDDVDEVDDWYDNQFNSALRGLTATPETYFNAVPGTPEYLRNFNTPATSSTVSDAFVRIANLTDTQDIASTLSEYYGYNITPAEQSFNRFGGNLQTHTSSSKEQLQEFHSLVEPILQEQVPFLQATEGLNYQDALIEAYKRDPMLQSLYYKYDVTPIRQTDDGSTYLYDPFTYGEIRTLEVKDPSISDIAKSVLPTLALSAILGPIAGNIVGSLGATGTTANVLSSALASAASAGIQGADLEDALTAGLLGGANTFLSPYVASALSDVGLDLGTGLNTLGISQDDLARLGAGTITGVASGEDLDQALLSGVGSLIQQRAMDSLQGIFEPTTEIDISAQTDRYMPVGDIPETEAGAAFADQVAGIEVPTIPDFNDLSLYSDLEVPFISGPTSGTPRPPSFLPTEDFRTFGLGDSFVFRPSADTSGLLTSNRFLEQPNVVDLLEDPTQIVDPNRFDRFYPEPVFSPITPPELRVEPTVDLTPPELDIPEITFDLPEFVQPPIDIAPPPVFVQPPQPIIPTPTTGGGGGASGGGASGGAASAPATSVVSPSPPSATVTPVVPRPAFPSGSITASLLSSFAPSIAPAAVAPQPAQEPSDNIFENTVAGPSAEEQLAQERQEQQQRQGQGRLDRERQQLAEQERLEQQRLERERQGQANRERAEAEAARLAEEARKAAEARAAAEAKAAAEQEAIAQAEARAVAAEARLAEQQAQAKADAAAAEVARAAAEAQAKADAAAAEARYEEAVAAGEALGEAKYGEGLGTGRGQGAGAGIGAGLGLGLLAGIGGGAGGTGGYTPPDFEDYDFRKTYQAPELLELAPQYESYQAPTLQGLFRGFI